MDGDNITIYDNDSDEEEWEEEEEGEKGQEAVTRQEVFEGDIMEKSLRSCLSKAKLWNSSDKDKVHTHTHTPHHYHFVGNLLGWVVTCNFI